MKNLLTKIGKKSKEAFIDKLSSKKKDKVLKDYYNLIDKNRKLIINITQHALFWHFQIE